MTIALRSRLPGGVALGVALAVAGLAGQAIPPPPPPPPPLPSSTAVPTLGTGAISGVLIDGVSGQPVAGAIVAIAGGSRGIRPAGPTRMLTDGLGRFVFSRLPAGNYIATAAKTGYLQVRYGQSDPTTASSQAIRLADGQWFTNARITIWRPGSITGTVTDEAGEPVVGIVVRVISQVFVAGRPQLASGVGAKTDDRGRYRAAGLYNGRYVVMVPSVQATVPADVTPETLGGYTAEQVKAAEAAGRPLTLPNDPALVIDPRHRLILRESVTLPPPAAGWAYPVTFAPAARTIGGAAIIDLNVSEERAGVDVQIAPVRAVRVSGVLDGPPEAAAAGMTIRLLPEGSDSLGFGAETATSLVGPNGEFAFFNVPSGNYTLVAARSTMQYSSSGDSLGALTERPAYPPGATVVSSGSGVIASGSQGVRYSFSNVSGPAAYSARTPLVVGTQPMTDIVVPLKRGVTMTGTFVFADNQPAADSPVFRLGLSIYAEPANGDALLGMPARLFGRDDPMNFRIEGLLSGPYVLRGLGIGGIIKSIAWEGRDYTDRPFDGSIGRDINGVVITLTSRVARINGSVRASGGQMAAEGAVIAFPTDKTLWTNSGFRPARLISGVVSTAGTFTLPSVPAGEYYLVAVAPAQAREWQDPRFLEVASRTATRVTLDWGETRSQDLAITVVGSVR